MIPRLSSSLAALTFTAFVPLIAAQSTCNGQASFCQRSYSNITFIGAHDSPNVNAGSVAANQNYTVTTQLDNGIRMLQGQIHNTSTGLHLCHTTCTLLDDGPFVDYLKEVRAWLDGNPDEVVTMLWVNSDNQSPATIAAAYRAAQMVDYSYVPPNTPMTISDWPTLGAMITAGTRAVSFLSNGANQASVKYLLDEFSQAWETPYDETDTAFPCTVDRITAGVDPTSIMYIVNHFLDVNVTFLGDGVTVPNTAALGTTNGQSGTGSLGLQASQCAAQHGHNPNFLLVDYYDVPTDGSVFKVAAALNGVQYSGTIGNGTSLSASASSSAPSSSASSSSSSQSKSSSTSDAASVGGVGWSLVGGTVMFGLALVGQFTDAVVEYGH